MTDMDELMTRLSDLDHTDPASWLDKDIDAVIALQRKYRAQREAGVKIKKGTNPDIPKKKLTLADLGINMKPKIDPNFKRRV